MGLKISALVTTIALFLFSINISAQERVVDVPIAVRFTGTKIALSWALVAEPQSLKAVGILREGDKISIFIPNAPDITFAQSKMVYRWLAGKHCRKRFLQRSKCTETWANTPCHTPMTDNPVNGSIRTTLTFFRDAEGGSKVGKMAKYFGNGVANTTVAPKLPVRMAISGGLKKTLPKCSRAMNGVPVSNNPTLHGNPIGMSTPVSWFTIRVKITSPEFES